MLLSIFSQSLEPMANPTRLTLEAARHFSIDLEAQSQASDVLCLGVAGQPTPAAKLRSRAASPKDQRLAREAERLSGAAGMGDLAARCPHLLELDVHPDTHKSVGYQLAACIAFVALGPVLTEDKRALLGVRSAMKLADSFRI